MQHHFDIEHAKRYGVEEAIVINCFQFWIAHNRANGKHQHDGRTWTFNSVKALSEIFDYWTPKQIRRIMDSLQRHNVLVTGNYNNLNYDRTTWYAFENESLFLDGQPHLPKRAKRSAQTGNTIGPNGPTIPVDNPVDNPVDKREARAKFQPPTLEEITSLFSEKISDSSMAAREAGKFFAHYESNGWRVGKNKMQKWRAAAAGWITRMNDYSPTTKQTSNGQATNQPRHLIDEETARKALARLHARGYK